MANFLIVTDVQRVLAGVMTAFSREPSGSRTSTIGAASSSRRPAVLTMRLISCRSSSSLSKYTSETDSFTPSRMAKMRSGPLMMISSMRGSSISGCSRPSPNRASNRRRLSPSASISSGEFVVTARRS